MAFNFSAAQMDIFAGPGTEDSLKNAHRSPQRSRRNPLAASSPGQLKHRFLR
jgi:hypothetical protein